MASTSLRLSVAVLDRAQAVADQLGVDRSDALRMAIMRGLPILEKEQAGR